VTLPHDIFAPCPANRANYRPPRSSQGFLEVERRPGLCHGFEPGAPDHERATYFYRRGCSAAFGLGCTLLAQAYAKGLGVPQDEPRAVEILQLSCRAGTMSACSDLSSFYFLGTGGLEQSHEQGISLLTRACEHGHTSSCKNESKAMQYLKLACDGGDRMGCAQLLKDQSATVQLP
jgi:TPR repeat protein